MSSAAICSSATVWPAYAAKSQAISASVSGLVLSRLTRISDTTSGMARSLPWVWCNSWLPWFGWGGGDGAA